jgi:hypothetical protein
MPVNHPFTPQEILFYDTSGATFCTDMYHHFFTPLHISIAATHSRDKPKELFGIVRKWVADITFIETREGWLYRATSA